jgi:hypothetical protein
MAHESPLTLQINTKPQIQAEISSCDFLDYRIFNDDATVQWVSENPVMIILRGLPGSGKSMISEMLVKLYSAVNSEEPVICSADHFFTDVKGLHSLTFILFTIFNITHPKQFMYISSKGDNHSQRLFNLLKILFFLH